MFSVVVSLKQSGSLVEFEDDAADAPDVAGMMPSQFENDFRRAVMARGHDRRVMFVVERRVLF